MFLAAGLINFTHILSMKINIYKKEGLKMNIGSIEISVCIMRS